MGEATELDRALYLEGKGDKKSRRIIIINSKDKLVGLLVDSVNDVVELKMMR